MNISEFRETIKTYKEDDLRLLLSEMYKAMPKKLREDKDIDGMVRDLHGYISNSKGKKKQEVQVDFSDLEADIEEFIEYAYKQYYMAPNSYVHKSERPKWRFKVKAFINQLQTIPADSEDGQKATDLLGKLYNVLSYACNYYLFRSDDPFASVGIVQTTYLDTILKRKLGIGINRESVKSCISFVINSNVDRETTHIDLFYVLIGNLKTPDAKRMAIEQALVFKTELDKSKRANNRNYDDFSHREKVNNLVEGIAEIYMMLCEYDDAIAYYKSNYVYHDQEITLYCVLRMLFKHKLKDLWIREFDIAVKNGIKPREGLQNMYEYIQENGNLPEFIY